MSQSESPMPQAEQPGQQPRQLRNDELVLHAALTVAARDGWGGLTLTATAVEAGLSRRAVHSRLPTRVALGVAVWTTQAGPALSDALEALLDGAGLLGGEPSEAAVTDALDELGSARAELRAAAELLVIAHVDPAVRVAVTDTLGARVVAWCSDARADHAMRSRRGHLLMVGLGRCLAARSPGLGPVQPSVLARLLMAAVRTDRQPTELPQEAAPDLALESVFDTGDELLDALLLAVSRLVGERGFDQASTAEIAAASGFSEGLLYSRYDSKSELFLDATQRMAETRLAANDAYIAAIASRHGTGIAEAVTMREWQRPGLDVQRTLNLEQIRLSWHDEVQFTAIEAAMRSQFDGHVQHDDAGASTAVAFGFTIGLGAVALPLLLPECTALSYDVMTVPLVALGL